MIVQRDDGTLALHFEEGPFAGGNDALSIPFEPGLNCRMAFAGGELVRVGFAGASPDGMFAFGRTWNAAPTRGVARLADTVDGVWLLLNPGTGGASLEIVPAETPGALHITGAIDSASEELKIP